MKLGLEGERNAFRVGILRGQGMGMICDISFLGNWAEVNSAHLLRERNKMKDRNFSERVITSSTLNTYKQPWELSCF